MNKLIKRFFVKGLNLVIIPLLFSGCSAPQSKKKTNTVNNEEDEKELVLKHQLVGTGQTKFYDKDGNMIDAPTENEPCYGQDAQYGGLAFSFTDNDDGTITDNNTGLMWQQIPNDAMVSFSGAAQYCEDLEFAGHNDWRIPSTKELFSLINFEPGTHEPCLDTNYFKFPAMTKRPMGGGPQGNKPEENRPQGNRPQGDRPQGDRPQNKFHSANATTDNDSANHTTPPPPRHEKGRIGKEQGQFWTSDLYKVGTTHGGAETGFGVNHVSGHIKGYPTSDGNPSRGKHVRAVRGKAYLANNFVDNGDGTISDLATGLMWMKDDYGESIMWEEALAYCENLEFAGYTDWKLPNVKELQSIVDYSGVYPAINPNFFNSTQKENDNYYTWLWTNTSANEEDGGDRGAWYVAFGKGVGLDGQDTHGAGAVRERQRYAESASTEEGDTYACSLRAVRLIK